MVVKGFGWATRRLIPNILCKPTNLRCTSQNHALYTVHIVLYTCLVQTNQSPLYIAKSYIVHSAHCVVHLSCVNQPVSDLHCKIIHCNCTCCTLCCTLVLCKPANLRGTALHNTISACTHKPNPFCTSLVHNVYYTLLLELWIHVSSQSVQTNQSQWHWFTTKIVVWAFSLCTTANNSIHWTH